LYNESDPDDRELDRHALARVLKFPAILDDLEKNWIAKTHQLLRLSVQEAGKKFEQLRDDDKSFHLVLCSLHLMSNFADACFRFGALEASVILRKHLAVLLDYLKKTTGPLSPLFGDLEVNREELTDYFLTNVYALQQAYEAVHWYGPALKLTHDTLAMPEFNGRIPCKAFAHLFDPLFTMPASKEFFAEGHQSPVPSSTAESDAVKPVEWTEDLTSRAEDQSKYTEREISLLCISLLAFKMTYAAGYPQLLVPLKDMTSSLITGRDLHLTKLRNNVAYNAIALPYAMLHKYPLQFDLPKLYVVGDSHSFTSAWQTVTLGGGKKWLLCGKLVTGCKVWHWREILDFLPKSDFWLTINSIPSGSKVILLFGEIDCREGVVMATQRGVYNSLEDGFEATIDIYMQMLERLQAPPYNFDIYVHPPIPGVDVTRSMVHTFDDILRRRVTPIQSKTLHFIDIADKLVDSEWKDVLPEFKHDETHIAQAYVPKVLEPALASLIV